jgi:hypothetical protein
MNIQEIAELLKDIKFPGMEFVVGPDRDGAKIQGRYIEKDIVTGQDEFQYTRKWLISPYATKSEIIQTAFKLCLTSMEHRTREHFRYKRKAIFGPHFDVDALWEVCNDKRFDVRKDGSNDA